MVCFHSLLPLGCASSGPMTAPLTRGTSNRPPIRWGLILAVWSVYGVVNSVQQYVVSYLASGEFPKYPWWQPFVLQMPQAYIWALATPGILWLGRRFPFERNNWLRNGLIHAVICLTFVFLLDFGFTWHAANVMPLPPNAPPLITRGLRMFAVWVLSDSTLYWI